MDMINELFLLVRARYPIIHIRTLEEKRVEKLVSAVAQQLGNNLFTWSVAKGLCRYGLKHAIYDSQKPNMALGHIAIADHKNIYLLKDFHKFMEDAVLVRQLRELAEAFSQNPHGALIICAPDFPYPREIKGLITSIELELPTKGELVEVIEETIAKLPLSMRSVIRMSRDDINKLATNMRGLTTQQAERALTHVILREGKLTQKYAKAVLKAKETAIEEEGVLDYIHPDPSLLNIGGMDNLKAWLDKRRKAFSPEAEKFGLEPPKGILMVGIPGCGKSLLAKTVGAQWELPLLKMDPGRLYGKYIGESEENFRKATGMAESMSPVILWIDEIEKGFSYSQGPDSDSGLSKRIFGSFLSWMQEKKNFVFIIATSNDVTQLPPEFLRKGRFDEIFFVDLPTLRERVQIIAIHLKKRQRDAAGFDVQALAKAMKGFSGAEIEQAIISALYAAFSGAGKLTTKIILDEVKKTVPLSVTMKEKVSALREWARTRAVAASKR